MHQAISIDWGSLEAAATAAASVAANTDGAIDWGDDLLDIPAPSAAAEIDWGADDEVVASATNASVAIEVVESGESSVIRATLLEHDATREQLLDEYFEVRAECVPEGFPRPIPSFPPA
eukprot:m.664709 g.664709  ORF g.664709 m.664709 type:complete len:119 (+) comp58490_c0_seq45:931-1287(+)